MRTKPDTPATQSKRSWTPMHFGLIGSALLLATTITSTYFRANPVSPNSAANLPNQSASMPKAPITSASTSPNISTEEAALPANLMNTSFPLLKGSRNRFSNFEGKVLLVDLWATWCGPCRREIPHLIELAKEFNGRGLEVIGLTTEDPIKDAEKVRQFVAEFKINYPIGWANEELAQGLMKGHNLIPQTYVIGRNGQVRKYFVGFNPQTSPSQLRAAVEEAIQDK